MVCVVQGGAGLWYSVWSQGHASPAHLEVEQSWVKLCCNTVLFD